LRKKIRGKKKMTEALRRGQSGKVDRKGGQVLGKVPESGKKKR